MKGLIALVIAIIVGVVGYFYFPLNNDYTPPVRIGLNPWPGYEFFYLAEQKGFYKQLGVDVDIIEYSSLEDVRYGFEKGQIDVMNSTLIELLLSDNRTEKSPKVFFVSDFSNGGDVILAKPGFNNISSLKGKKIAVEPESLGLYMLARALQKDNMTIDDITMVGLPQLEMEDALKEGKVDAIVSYPPVSIQVMKNIEGIKNIFSSKDIPGEVIDVASASSNFIKTRGHDLSLIIDAWDMAVDYARENPDDANAIMAEREKISKEEFAEVLLDMKILKRAEQDTYIKPGGPVEKAIELSIKVFEEVGFLKTTTLAEDLIDRDSLQGIK